MTQGQSVSHLHALVCLLTCSNVVRPQSPAPPLLLKLSPATPVTHVDLCFLFSVPHKQALTKGGLALLSGCVFLRCQLCLPCDRKVCHSALTSTCLACHVMCLRGIWLIALKQPSIRLP